MNPKSPHDLSELDLLKKRVKDLEKLLGKQDADSENKMHLQAKVLDQIQDTVTITDLLGNITYVNQAQVQKFQRSKEDFIGRPFSFEMKMVSPSGCAISEPTSPNKYGIKKRCWRTKSSINLYYRKREPRLPSAGRYLTIP